MSAPVRGPALLLALAASGCAFAHQCRIPVAPLAAPPGAPLPARVGLAVPAGLAEKRLAFHAGESGYAFPVGAAAVATFQRAAGQLFQAPEAVATSAPVAGGPEAVLELSLASAELFPGALRPEEAEVTVHGVLRGAGGVVAQASATARAEGEPVRSFGMYHCDASGVALAGALARATARVRDELGASPAVAAWVRDPARAPLPAEPPAPLVAPEQPPASERVHRSYLVPRYLEADVVWGTGWSSAPGVGRVSGAGWGLRMAYDLGERFALGMHAATTSVKVGFTPDPGQPTDTAELGFIGLEGLWRFRPGERLRPWIALTGGYQGVVWSSYFYSVAGWSLLASAGVDVQVVPWGAVRLGLTGSAFGATTSSSVSSSGTTPGPGADGWTAGMQTLYLTAGWVFDLGPAR